MPAIERVIPLVGQLPASIREALARRLRELAGLGLIALAGVAAAALMTWSVQDPSLSHATSRAIRNVVGYPGAIGADLLMQILGLGAIMLILPVGVGCWLVTGTLIVLAARWARARKASTKPGWLPARWATGVAVAATAGVAALAVASLPRQTGAVRYVMRDPALAVTRTAASEIEHMLPGQRVALLVQDTHEVLDGRVAVSLTWALTPSGFHAEITKSRLARELGSSYVYHGRAIKLVTVVIRDGRIRVRVTNASKLPASLRLASSRDIGTDLSGIGQRLR